MRIKYADIRKAVKRECFDGKHHMRLTGADDAVVKKAVNQGIDSHLEAVFVPERGDSFVREGGFLVCKVSEEGLCALLRRMFENEEEESLSLATAILESLGFKFSAGDDVEVIPDREWKERVKEAIRNGVPISEKKGFQS
jgi:hypothetical protein